MLSFLLVEEHAKSKNVVDKGDMPWQADQWNRGVGLATAGQREMMQWRSLDLQ